MDLITRTRALRNVATLTAPTTAENDALDSFIAATSNAIERYCGRVFGSASYDEVYDGNDRTVLHLANFPVISVERVAYDPTAVLQVQNTSTSNQRATVKVTSTGLSLTRVASGVATTSTLAFASYATLTDLAAAINALGNGWSATVVTGFGSYASADLRAIQGAFAARETPAELVVHVQELSFFQVDEQRGVLSRGRGCGRTDALRLATPVFHGGRNYWRVIYTAGFATAPEAVQEACAEWVAALFWQSKRDPGLAQEAQTGIVSRVVREGMPGDVQTLLRPFRVIRI